MTKRPSHTDPVTSDTRSGTDEFSLTRKHGLSNEGLHATDPVSAADLSIQTSEQRRRAVSCPSCGYAQTGAMDECPRCGIVVSKLAERGRVGREPKSMRTAGLTEAETGKRGSWAAVAISVVLCLVLGGALWKWSGSGIQRSDHANLATGAGQESSGLKKFTYDNLQEDVVAVSRKQPVLIEFYSDH